MSSFEELAKVSQNHQKFVYSQKHRLSQKYSRLNDPPENATVLSGDLYVMMDGFIQNEAGIGFLNVSDNAILPDGTIVTGSVFTEQCVYHNIQCYMIGSDVFATSSFHSFGQASLSDVDVSGVLHAASGVFDGLTTLSRATVGSSECDSADHEFSVCGDALFDSTLTTSNLAVTNDAVISNLNVTNTVSIPGIPTDLITFSSNSSTVTTQEGDVTSVVTNCVEGSFVQVSCQSSEDGSLYAALSWGAIDSQFAYCRFLTLSTDGNASTLTASVTCVKTV